MKRLLGSAVVMAAAAVGLTGCGGSTSSADDCVTVPADGMQGIADGADKGKEIVAKEAKAVPGAEEGNYFVAMRFTAPDGKDAVGVWLTHELTAAKIGPIVAVDGFAKQFTHWPDAAKAFDISPAHPSALAAKDCLS